MLLQIGYQIGYHPIIHGYYQRFLVPDDMKILKFHPNPLLRFLVNLRQPSRTRSKNRSFGLTIPMYRLKKIKNLESENNHITIMNTFWSTELNSRPILSHEGSICVSETQSDHFQSQKIGFRDKKSPQSKISESKTAREYSFLRSS